MALALGLPSYADVHTWQLCWNNQEQDGVTRLGSL